MIALTRQQWITMGSTAVCAVLLGIILVPTADLQLPAPSLRAAPEAKDPPVGGLPHRMPDEASFLAINERPLFSPSRAFEPDVPAAPQKSGAAASATPNFLRTYGLTGVIIGDQQSVALFRPKAGGPVKTLKIGDNWEGWSVAEINEDEVIFASGGSQYTVSFPRPLGAHPSPAGHSLPANVVPHAR